MLVGSQGSGLIETFSFNLSNGHVSAIANTPTDTSNQTCVLNGVPASMVIDPAGVYAYAIFNAEYHVPEGEQDWHRNVQGQFRRECTTSREV